MILFFDKTIAKHGIVNKNWFRMIETISALTTIAKKLNIKDVLNTRLAKESGSEYNRLSINAVIFPRTPPTIIGPIRPNSIKEKVTISLGVPPKIQSFPP